MFKISAGHWVPSWLWGAYWPDPAHVGIRQHAVSQRAGPQPHVPWPCCVRVHGEVQQAQHSLQEHPQVGAHVYHHLFSFTQWWHSDQLHWLSCNILTLPFQLHGVPPSGPAWDSPPPWPPILARTPGHLLPRHPGAGQAGERAHVSHGKVSSIDISWGMGTGKWE